MPALTAETISALWRDLGTSICRQSPQFDSILVAIQAADDAAAPLMASPPAPSRAALLANLGCAAGDEAPVDWLDLLGDDLVVVILRTGDMASTGAVAACCRGLHEIASRDEVWHTHAQRLDVDVAGATAARPCAAMCRDLCSRRRLEAWLDRVEELSRQAGADTGRVNELLEDASRRLSKLQFEDYREAQRTRNPPSELVLAARLLQALFGDEADEWRGATDALAASMAPTEIGTPAATDGSSARSSSSTLTAVDDAVDSSSDSLQTGDGGSDSRPSSGTSDSRATGHALAAVRQSSPTGSSCDGADEPSRDAVAWLQRLLPQIGAKRGEHAQLEVAPFLHRFLGYEPDATPPANVVAVEAILPECCLRRLDLCIERRVREGYPLHGGAGCGPSQSLRAARVASALTRWVVATANLVILRRRERQLTAVAREIFRCRANVPPVRVLI